MSGVETRVSENEQLENRHLSFGLCQMRDGNDILNSIPSACVGPFLDGSICEQLVDLHPEPANSGQLTTDGS